MSYRYTDFDGAGMKIERSNTPEMAFLCSERGVFIPAADLPKVVAGLYEAAGQEPPILLPRPNVDALRAAGWIDGNRVNPEAIHAIGTTTPGVARGLAACLAASADVAEAEPSPEQVKQLAGVITAAGVLGSAAETIAHAILRAGYVRGDA